MIQEVDNLDFSEDSLGINDVVKGIGDLLDGNHLSSFLINGGAHDAIGTGADGFDGGILAVYDEFAAGHVEGVSIGALLLLSKSRH